MSLASNLREAAVYLHRAASRLPACDRFDLYLAACRLEDSALAASTPEGQSALAAAAREVCSCCACDAAHPPCPRHDEGDAGVWTAWDERRVFPNGRRGAVVPTCRPRPFQQVKDKSR